jgi:hypothetical protein
MLDGMKIGQSRIIAATAKVKLPDSLSDYKIMFYGQTAQSHPAGPYYKELDRYRRHDHGGPSEDDDGNEVDDGDGWLPDHEIKEDYNEGVKQYSHELVEVNHKLKAAGYEPNAEFDLGEKGHFGILFTLVKKGGKKKVKGEFAPSGCGCETCRCKAGQVIAGPARTKEIKRELDSIAEKHGYGFEIVSPQKEGIYCQMRIHKHDLKVHQEDHPEHGILEYVEKEDAKKLIPEIKKAFSKFKFVEQPKLFSMGTSPSYCFMIGYW